MGMTDAENANRGGGSKGGSKSGGGTKGSSGGGSGYSPASERAPSKGGTSAPSGASRGGNSGSNRGGGSGYSPASERSPSYGGGNRSQAPSGAARGDGNSRSNPSAASASYGRSKSMADSVSRSLSDMASSVSRSLGLDRAAAAISNTAKQGAVNIMNGGPKATTSVNLGGLSGNARAIAEQWAAAGWTDTQIQAGLGRISVESDFNPAATRKNDAGPGKHSVGIAQWNRGRLSNLQGYAAAKNADWQDVRVQADFVNHEMYGDPAVKGQYGYQSEKKAGQALKGGKTVEEAAVGMMHYERPYGYTSKNPTAGMHWDKTINRSTQYAGLMGQPGGETQVASSELGFGDMVASALGGVFGGTQGSPASSTQTAYVDPYVVNTNSRKSGAAAAIETQAPGSGQVAAIDPKDPRNRPREGVAKLGQQLEEGNILGAAKLATDPVGLVLGTIEDMWNQNGGLAGLKDDIAGLGSGDFKMTASKGSLGSGHSGSQESRSPFNKKKKVANPATPVAAPTVKPTPELAVTPVVDRKPFQWSTILAGIGPGIKTV